MTRNWQVCPSSSRESSRFKSKEPTQTNKHISRIELFRLCPENNNFVFPVLELSVSSCSTNHLHTSFAQCLESKFLILGFKVQIKIGPKAKSSHEFQRWTIEEAMQKRQRIQNYPRTSTEKSPRLLQCRLPESLREERSNSNSSKPNTFHDYAPAN